MEARGNNVSLWGGVFSHVCIGHGQVLVQQKCLIDHSITRGHGFDKTTAGNVALQLLGLILKERIGPALHTQAKKEREVKSDRIKAGFL